MHSTSFSRRCRVVGFFVVPYTHQTRKAERQSSAIAASARAMARGARDLVCQYFYNKRRLNPNIRRNLFVYDVFFRHRRNFVRFNAAAKLAKLLVGHAGAKTRERIKSLVAARNSKQKSSDAKLRALAAAPIRSHHQAVYGIGQALDPPAGTPRTQVAECRGICLELDPVESAAPRLVRRRKIFDHESLKAFIHALRELRLDYVYVIGKPLSGKPNRARTCTPSQQILQMPAPLAQGPGDKRCAVAIHDIKHKCRKRNTRGKLRDFMLAFALDRLLKRRKRVGARIISDGLGVQNHALHRKFFCRMDDLGEHRGRIFKIAREEPHMHTPFLPPHMYLGAKPVKFYFHSDYRPR